jgi:hypothetical protein
MDKLKNIMEAFISLKWLMTPLHAARLLRGQQGGGGRVCADVGVES